MRLEDHVKDALADLAERVPPRIELADAALRQARRRRHAAKMGVAGGTAVAVVGGGVFAVVDPLALRATSPSDVLGIPDTFPSQPQPSSTPPATNGSVSIDLDELPTGAPPSVPWYAEGTLHLGGNEVPFEGEFGGISALHEVAGGYAVLTTPGADGVVDDHELSLITPDGDRTTLGIGAILSVGVSPNGRLVAWSEYDWGPPSRSGPPVATELYVADTTTGETRHTKQQSSADGLVGSIAGFLDDGRVVLDNANSDLPERIYVWDLTADTVTPWTDYGFTNAIARSGDVGAFTSPSGSDDHRTVVVDTATEQVLWSLDHRYRLGANAFSPHGRYAALVAWDGPPASSEQPTAEELERLDEAGATASDKIIIVDARSGEPLLTIDTSYPVGLAWESDATLVVEAWPGETRMALVRCTVDGECELAAAPRDTDQGAHELPLPYSLGSPL